MAAKPVRPATQTLPVFRRALQGSPEHALRIAHDSLFPATPRFRPERNLPPAHHSLPPDSAFCPPAVSPASRSRHRRRRVRANHRHDETTRTPPRQSSHRRRVVRYHRSRHRAGTSRRVSAHREKPDPAFSTTGLPSTPAPNRRRPRKPAGGRTTRESGHLTPTPVETRRYS